MAKKPKPAPTGLIAEAVAPLRESAIQMAEKFARDRVAMVEEELAKAGNDLNVCAPYPSYKVHGVKYALAMATYNLFSALTKWRDGTYSGRGPLLADIKPELVERFIVQAKDMAALQYDEYVHKLVAKIGEVESAELAQGQNLWAHSILSVTKAGGVVERWKTQQIVNVSKLGTIFNQWPTRKMK